MILIKVHGRLNPTWPPLIARVIFEENRGVTIIIIIIITI